ncbi:unnamed protein product [Cylindrotheca closterium]|uniref:DUF6824 domain-containing protein n=1 Tax=Cylindrotheca closterium TaxID=2856 RepID=A0AAD2PWE8_9STRA|nr:unnamed protein product [Cylindrotheca closterium]
MDFGANIDEFADLFGETNESYSLPMLPLSSTVGAAEAHSHSEEHLGTMFRPPSQAEVDSLVARDMNALSSKDREQILHDIHGIADFPDEDPQMLQAKLDELDAAIKAIPQKAAYDRALAASESYVNDRSFRLKFLRADRLDPQRAGRRMVNFFDYKKELFGPEKLVKSIVMDDLNYDDMAVIQNGHMQFLPERDMAGRIIFCNIQSLQRCASDTNLLRAVYYMLMTQADDEDSQKKGVVGVLYNFSLMAERLDHAKIIQSVRLRNCLPIRFVAMHYCFNHPSFVDFINCERSAFDEHTRARCRAHQVSATDFHSELVSFGIASRSIPASLIGGLKSKSHQDWIYMRRKVEGNQKVSSITIPPTVVATGPARTAAVQPKKNAVKSTDLSTCRKGQPNVIENIDTSSDSEKSPPARKIYSSPSPGDVLFGRGKVKEHPGNVRLHQLIEKRRSRYEVAEKWEKTVIAEEIVAIIKECSGRFLRPTVNSDGWVEVDKEIAREKVSHTFRSRRPKLQKRRRVTAAQAKPKLFLNTNFRY